MADFGKLKGIEVEKRSASGFHPDVTAFLKLRYMVKVFSGV